MARDSRNALVALNRFGFGARGGACDDFVNAACDPRGFIKADLTRPRSALLEVPGLQSTPELGRTLYQHQHENKLRDAAKLAQQAANGGPNLTMSPQDGMQPMASNDGMQRMAPQDAMQPNAAPPPATSQDAMQPNAPPPPTPSPPMKIYRLEVRARLQRAVMADGGFVERLVAFWSNHFCISIPKDGLVRMWAGSFEREAIRPHVLGRFADMLKAVEQHPAMLFFLDNQLSRGPASRFGMDRHKGLNENLAREIMELHTLGVNGGYTQEDVTSFARILTGWTFGGRTHDAPGVFYFHANSHEPGAQRVLGRVYEANGVAQGEAVLADIARHPSTAKFIATKFARHFVADEPPPALVAKLQDVFIKTDGDLGLLANALIDADEAWDAPLSKIRSPYEYLIATFRLLSHVPEVPDQYIGALMTLGQPIWSPEGPNGFSDTNAVWAAPANMKLRLDLATHISKYLPESVDPRELVDLFAADAASEDTRGTIERAESRQQAMVLLMMSPEFQRR